MPFEPNKRTESSTTQALIDNFYRRMMQLYDYEWTNRYGDYEDVNGDGIWARILKQLTKAQVALGIQTLMTPGGPHANRPPKPLEFRNMAMGCTHSPYRTHHTAYKDFKRELPKPRNVEVGFANLDAIRKSLGVK